MSIKIHPSIGVARLGNSPEGKLLVPNKTGGLPHAFKVSESEEYKDFDSLTNVLDNYDSINQNDKDPVNFKDELGRVKRQGQPFRVYDENGLEITLERDDIKSIEWTVHLANKKAEWYDFDELKGNLLYNYNDKNDNEYGIEPGDNSYEAWERRKGITKRNCEVGKVCITEVCNAKLSLGESCPDKSKLYFINCPDIPEYHNTQVYLEDNVFYKDILHQFPLIKNIYNDKNILDRPILLNEIIDSGLSSLVKDKRKDLWVDFGPRRISGKSQKAIFDNNIINGKYKIKTPPSDVKYGHVIEKLGDIETDDKGRLIVFGGRGYTGGDTDLAGFGGGDAWHDDVSDGIVLCKVVYNKIDEKTGENKKPDIAKAWCIVGSPDFAPEIVNITTLSDSIFDVYVRNKGLISQLYDDSKEGFNKKFLANYNRDIKPIFDRMKAYKWLANVQPMTAFADQDFSDLNLSLEIDKSNFLIREICEDKELRDFTEDDFIKLINDYEYFYKHICKGSIKLYGALTKKQIISYLKRRKIYNYFRGIDPFTGKPRDIPYAISKKEYLKNKENTVLKNALLVKEQSLREDFSQTEYPQEYLMYNQNDQFKYEKDEQQVVGKEIVKIGNLFPLMPLNSGTNSVRNENPLKFMALTETQLFLLEQWAVGKFELGNENDCWENNEIDKDYFKNINLSNLGNCIGLPMSPGIEVTWSMHNPNIYDDNIPFTIKIIDGIENKYDELFNNESDDAFIEFLTVNRDECETNEGCEPGDLTKRMACPWQADFINCTVQPINFTNPLRVKDYIYSENDPKNYNVTDNSIELKSDEDLKIIKREVTAPVYYSYWWPASSPWDTIVGDFTKEAQAINGGIESGRQMNYQRGINSYNQMVEFWDTLSFIRNVNYKNEGFPYFVEMERNHEFFESKQVSTLLISENKLDCDVVTPIFYLNEEKAEEKRFEQYNDEIKRIKEQENLTLNQSSTEVKDLSSSQGLIEVRDLIKNIKFKSFSRLNSSSTSLRNRR